MFAAAVLFTLTLGQSSPAVSVVGCVEASKVNHQDQFTLIAQDTNRAEADVKTLTYTLVSNQKTDLKAFVGKRVEVTGTESGVVARATGGDDTKATEQPRGTSGKTPTVETKSHTDIVVRQLTVTSVKPATGDCKVP